MASFISGAKPTIVLVPGAWFDPSTYDALFKLLQQAGYATRCTPYPSLNSVNPFKTDCAADATFLRESVLVPMIEEKNNDIMVVMHSYGGMPGSVAAKGLGKVQRMQEGKKGGVVGLVFISGFVLAEGASVADGMGGALPDWVKEDDPTPGLTMPADPVTILSADLEPSLARANAADLKPHATLAFKSPSPPPAWVDEEFQGRLAYIVCTEDLAIPKFGQEAMMQRSGKEWMVKEVQGSHNAPFFHKVEETVEALENFLAKFSVAESKTGG